MSKRSIRQDKAEVLRPVVHDSVMHDHVSPERSGALHKIQAAEEWRQLGERLRRADPVLYEHVFAFLVLSIPESSSDDAVLIT